MEARLTTKVSLVAVSVRVAILLRLSCVFRSASKRAELTPTPNMIPADVGVDKRDRYSGIRSLSIIVHCRSIGNHPCSANFKELAQKNRGSLKASATSFFQVFDASGILDIAKTMLRIASVTF